MIHPTQRTSAPINDEYAWAQRYAYAMNGAMTGGSTWQQYAGQMKGTPYVQGSMGTPQRAYLGGAAVQVP